MPKVLTLRNELYVRLDDVQIAWLDTRRGEEPRSSFVRRLIQREAIRDLVQGQGDAQQD
jgi:hypothetical protein